MKKLFIFSVFFYLISINSFAQKNNLKLGSITFGGTNYGIQYERLFSKQFSLVLQYGVAVSINWSPTILFGNGVYVEGRYYFNRYKDLMEGWHLGVNFNYIDTTLESDFENNYLERYGFGPVAGYQWVFTNHITLDTIFGCGWMHTSTNLPEYHKGLFPLIGVNVGYNF